MENSAVPKTVRRLVVLSSAFLVASVAISGFSAYVTLASPLQVPYVPSTVGFEGQLADGDGSPVSDGDYQITFSLYNVSTGGTAIWSETQTVSVADGLYSVHLGSVSALDSTDFEGDRWLGVQVSGDSEMTPRIHIGAVPFALNARQAMGLQGRDVGTTAPSDGDVLKWDETSSEWIPGGPEVPADAILMIPGTCPTGFSEYTDARGRYVVGVPLSGTVEGTAGTALSDLENRPVGEHSHTINDPGHTHDYTDKYQIDDKGALPGGSGVPNEDFVDNKVTDSATTGITLNNAGTVPGTNAPYIQLRFCQKD